MGHLTFQCLLVLCVISAVTADCFNGPLHRRVSNGRMERYCMTDEVIPKKIDYGRRVKTDNCYSCSCSRRGMHCCGFGIKAGNNAQRVPVPPGCMLVVDGCNYYMIHAKTGAHC
ncbi:beta-microseminoprotein-like [Babylonia areolata]|uniref:beta-microseminoprotein-like n=1 Tax=Babylonia areolata TaxID=304850 RepID=UPI003FD0B4B0